MQIAERITLWRESRGMTKAEFARRVKLSSAAVAQWESGDTEPTLESIDAIVKALDITLSEFWGDTPRRKARAS